MLRLQGFPDAYQIVCGYSAMRKLTGNAVAVPVVEAVLRSVLDALNGEAPYHSYVMQASFFLKS